MIHIDGPWFKDEYGRTLILRGVNLGGSSKVPFSPDGATHRVEGFYNHRDVSFIGRPFPLDDADEHFRRLRSWGLTFLRLVITWEAVEHAGPGIYDRAYLDYLYEIARKAGEYDISLFVDPHQDVWGRLSGGDGAPGWTYECVGMDVTRLHETGAAIVHCVHGDPFPPMIWPSNYSKLAAATMFTLFFGGNDFAPLTIVHGEQVQEFLQRCYVEAMKQVARRLKGLPNVVGYGTMNEPSAGFIGCTDLNDTGSGLRLGATPTPFQAMLLGAGFPQEVEVWRVGLLGLRQQGHRLVNPDGVRAWREGDRCVWRTNGVWDVDAAGEPRLFRPGHFAQVGGREVAFAADYLRPFLNRYARAIRSVDPHAFIFIEEETGAPSLTWGPGDAPDVVFAPHWYDGLTLMTKRFVPFVAADAHTQALVFGPRRVRRSFIKQLARLSHWAAEEMGNPPVLLGEFGIPFDMHDKRAYRTGDFSRQVRGLDANFRAVEANLLNCTLWNYTADNDNRWGDQWNDEDLSIFSRDQRTDPADLDSGGRALEAVVRPYPQKIAGEPLHLSFDVSRRVFTFEFRGDPSVVAPTEIFVSPLQYPNGCDVVVTDGSFEIDWDKRKLIYWSGGRQEVHRVVVRPRRGRTG